MTLHLQKQLLKRKDNGNLRELKVTQNLVDFSSNDYLGLARSTKLKDIFLKEWHGLGSTGSRLLTGNSHYAQELEKNIAAFHGYEAGLLFNCGYMANSGLLSTIAGPQETIFFDEAIHASMREGIRLSQARAYPFRHNSLDHLEFRLKNLKQGDKFICIESIYSTDGSKAPLKEISELARRHQAHLIVDEAHAVGVCGPQGCGLVAEENLTANVFAQIVTFGKALGTFGAIVLGSSLLKQALINFATPFIYTTALPYYALVAIKCSYELFPTLELERAHLRKLIQMLNATETAIQAIKIKGNEAVKLAAKRLAQNGFDVRPLTSPTVKQGNEVLRICLHAFNTEEENQMRKIIVAGTGPDIGKTVVSAILTTLLNGSYWKPVECGSSDTAIVRQLIDTQKHAIYSPAYSLNAPLSPHHAARLEGVPISMNSIVPPETQCPLIIESSGGILVPLTTKILMIDLFSTWQESLWVLVSNHYLGSINHTLLTIEALKQRRISTAGIIFNGKPNPDSEAAILKISKLPLLERLLPESYITPNTIQRYAKQWHHIIPQLTN